MKKKILHTIYKFAISRCKNSFFECSEMNLEQFCDYMCFELQSDKENDEGVDMDDNW
ncbi:hypothetical protein [uncultured Clostridium sp.]|jgi:hypothetical protein|uniref:hypothetical protein n=1 Tax=uncultured Clostridium sp. TaxID=59620 RepID=UPI00262F14F0|nr:hypothetical protein [uncultured Clostridium sp.]